VVGPAQDYPITPKAHGIDFLMSHRHLHFRSQRQWAIGRIRHTVVDAIRRFFNDNGFILIDTPIFTTVAGEEVGSLFEVDYFGEPIHLTQTGQLYLESAAMAYGKVYCFGPTFRAEKSKTRRHLTEFWMVEPEVAYIDLPGLLELAENFVSAIVSSVLANNRAELEMLEADIPALERVTPPFHRLTYSDCVDILTSDRARDFLARQLADFQAEKQADRGASRGTGGPAGRGAQAVAEGQDRQGVKRPAYAARSANSRSRIENNPRHAELAANFQWGKDLGGSDETIISLMHDKPVFVTHYPRDAKAFYMKTDRNNEKVVENYDLLAPAGFGEIIGGSVREDDHDYLMRRIAEENLTPDTYSLVPGPAPLRHRAPRRLRPGRGAHRGLDHRRKAHSPVHPLPADDGQGVYLILDA
jgi:asparaginyl-tRNA synthetase